ncbi:hypothetical protein HY413_03530 [Candidatus Kaiserbacteria bacterium]|nr:hypothetical protein [Candidatus Kaiserbacteria bacterium]
MRIVLGVLFLAVGVVAVEFAFLYTDHAVAFFHISGEHAQTLAQWMGIFIWLPLTIVGAAMFTKEK